MSQTEQRRMSRDAFFDWVEAQELRHELVDGRPVMMTGAEHRHAVITGNAFFVLKTQLRGHRCRPLGGDLAIAIPAGNIRYPDVSVDCGATADEARFASQPTVVLEVLSRTTSKIDQRDKLADYRTVPSLSHIVIVDPHAPQVRLFSREADGQWRGATLRGHEARVELPAIGAGFAVAELYAGLSFPPRPALLTPDEAA